MSRLHWVWTHGYDGVRTGAIGRELVEIKRTKKINFEEFLEFKILASSPKASLLLEDTEIEYRGVRYFIHSVTETEETGKYLEVYANANWYRLGERKFIGSLVIDSLSAREGLEAILVGSGWSIDAFSSYGGLTYSLELQDKTYLQLLRAWSNVTGLYLSFEPVNKIVKLTDTLGQNLGMTFRRGRNINGYKRTRIGPQITRMFPYGADDLNIAGVNGGKQYIEDFSFYTDRGVSLADARENHTKDAQYVDSSIVNQTDLLRVGQAKLAEQNEIVNYVELGVIDVSELIGLDEDYKVWDTVRFVHEDFGVDQETIIVSTIHHDKQPWKNQIELDTQVDLTDDDLSSTSRPQRSAEWVQFVGPVRANYYIRNDGDYIVARIPLRFREGGRANLHLDLFAIGVGNGNIIVTVVDFENEEAQQFKPLTVPYTDGQTVRTFMSWAVENLTGVYNYSVRVTTEASGGPSTSDGIDIEADAGTEDIEMEYESSFWIMAQGAVQETPVVEDSIRFDYVSDAAQSWVVPDNVTQITVTAAGAEGGASRQGPALNPGGRGGIVSATFPVIPGTIYDVYAPSQENHPTIGNAWPGAGTGGGSAGDGGGYAALVPAGSSLINALIVAAGGGGGAENAGDGGATGGIGGFFQGGDGFHASFSDAPGKGATQSAGGLGGTYGSDGGTGSFGQGGNTTAGGGFHESGGGGGGGWFGGGGGGGDNSLSGGGGGGSGMIDPSGTDLFIQDGANTGDGYIEISWETP